MQKQILQVNGKAAAIITAAFCVEQKGDSGMEDKKIAIITGASSGLGAEYARLLDKEGLAEIWLIARRKDRLETLAGTLETKCRCLPMDLTDEEALHVLDTEVAASMVTVAYLVNAAGLGCLGLSRECPRRETAANGKAE